MIAMSKPEPEVSLEVEVVEEGKNETIGIICILYCACCVAGISLVQRQMRSIHFSTMMLYYSILGIISLLGTNLIMSYVRGHKMMNYTATQFGYLTLASLFDFCGLCCQVVAT
jgi:hypothetical protein